MLYAQSGQRATPRARAACPACDQVLIAKCGELVTWHWSHQALDCDAWAEPESEWHRAWKRFLPPEHVEVWRPPHRADLVAPDGRVIELQHSSIDPATIRERETFYTPMAWLIDLRDCAGFELRPEAPDGTPRHGWAGFRWKHHRRAWLAATAPRYLDLGVRGLFLLVRYGEAEGRGFGWGIPIPVAAFVSTVLWAGSPPASFRVPTWTRGVPSLLDESATWELIGEPGDIDPRLEVVVDVETV